MSKVVIFFYVLRDKCKCGMRKEGFESCTSQQGMGERDKIGDYFLNLSRGE